MILDTNFSVIMWLFHVIELQLALHYLTLILERLERNVFENFIQLNTVSFFKIYSYSLQENLILVSFLHDGMSKIIIMQ